MKQPQGFGTPKQEISIKLIEREKLTDEGLINLIESHNLRWFAKVTKNGVTQQCGLIPFNNSKTKKIKLAVHLIFCPPLNIFLTQQETDKLVKIVTKKIYDIVDVLITSSS